MLLKGTVSISDIFRSSSANQHESGQAHRSASSGSTTTVNSLECQNTSDTASDVERISTFVSSSETLSAEILWAIKVTTAHYSERSCKDVQMIFRRMFPDSRIADKFGGCGRTKCHYLTRFGIAPHFKNLLMQNIKDNGDVVVMFDESLNCITNHKQMDVHARLLSWLTGGQHIHRV